MYASLDALLPPTTLPHLVRATHLVVAGLIFGYLALIVSGLPFW